jgi:antitoxin component of RelBE/YafQ-DinJ toxin-antitoxin module
MASNNKSFNLYLDEKYRNALREAASKQGTNVSHVIRTLLEKYVMNEDSATKVVLSIPKDVSKDTESLEKWLNIKKNALINYFKSTSH